MIKSKTPSVTAVYFDKLLCMISVGENDIYYVYRSNSQLCDESGLAMTGLQS
jgi:hypothetical protein